MIIAQIGPFPLHAECIQGGIESSVYGLSVALGKSCRVEVFDFPRINGKDDIQAERGMTIHRYRNSGRHNEDAAARCQEIVEDILASKADYYHIHGTGLLS
ncbi:MAG: hypothetical protein IJS62_01040 [Bacteroidales bacterium]|nr:hypothetical protein [Bacteroidales bacterium]